jgi:hypothetical protein
MGRVTTYSYQSTYDITDIGGTTQYQYDLMDRITNSDLSVTTYQYDFSGSLIPTPPATPGIQTFSYDYNYQLLSSLGLDQTFSSLGGLETQAVPEPIGAGLLLIGLFGLKRPGRRHVPRRG